MSDKRKTIENITTMYIHSKKYTMYIHSKKVHEAGFEPAKLYAMDLKSIPFDRSGIRVVCVEWDSNPR